MKKVLVAILAAVFFFAAGGCSKKKSDASETAAASRKPEVAHVGTAGAGTKVASEAEPRPSLSPEGEWPELFAFVRDAVRTEPSPFPLKTDDGIDWSRSANSLEKALFLARLLREKGMTVEIAKGGLDKAAARSLLASIFPSVAKTSEYGSGTPISNPADDRNLIAAVQRHFWVRADTGDGWIDLDPSFPAAEPGKAFAELEESHDMADEALGVKVRLSVTCDRGASGEPGVVLSWSGMLADVANKAVSLVVMTEYRGAEGESQDEGGGGSGGLFDSLSGGSTAKQKSADAAEAYLKVVLTAAADTLAEGEVAAKPESASRLSLRIAFESLGQVFAESERVLSEKSGPSGAPLFQRHALLVTGDRIPAAAWRNDLQRVSASGARSDARSKAEEIRSALKAQKATTKNLSAGVDLEAKLGTDLGHLVNMIFASTSDEETEKLGSALSVANWYAVPRVIITSFIGGRKQAEVTIDLRQDRVESVALPGRPWGMNQAFQYGRGVMESILEGKLLSLLTARPALTTAGIMHEAARRKIGVRMISLLEKEYVKTIGPPQEVQDRIGAALERGWVVLLPEKGVPWDGRSRWGWWEVDPRTRETIGVLDSGLHQAMIQRSVLEAEGPMQSEMGAVLGAMVGAIDTYWVLMAMVLKHGELTQEALQEAKAYIKDIQAILCPEFEKKISIEASVSVVDVEDCYKYDYEIYKAEAGVKISQGWCAQFAKGFACASTSILNYLISRTGG